MTGSAEVPRAARPALSSVLADAFAEHRAGDSGAATRLVSGASLLLWHLARSVGADEVAAEDAVQNAFLALFRSSDSIQDPQAVLKWLMVTTRREAIRLAAARGRVDLTDDGAIDVPSPRHEEPDQVLLDRDRDRILWAAVRQLSQRCQHLLRVVAFADRPDYAATAAALGMRIGSIGPTRGRCLAQLRALLAAEPGWSLP